MAFPLPTKKKAKKDLKSLVPKTDKAEEKIKASAELQSLFPVALDNALKIAMTPKGF